jgi:hypothetical protein
MNKEFKTFEVRNIQFSTEEREQKRYLKGFIPYNSRSSDLGGFTEIVTPTAFNKTLKDGKNVWALLDHKKDKVLGNTRSGTLKLESTPEGLSCEVEVPNTTYANDGYELMSRGVSNSMSFGFYNVKSTDDKETRTRYLNEVKLEEVSFLISEDPAYPTTTAKTLLRSLSEDFVLLDPSKITEEDRELLAQIKTKLDSILPDQKAEEAPKAEEVATEEKSSTDTSENQALLLEMEIESAIGN